MSDGRFGKHKPKDGRARNWTLIVYEDSAPENWREIIAGLHVPAYISPYHDQDVRADGSPKKPHWHVVLCFKGKKSIQQIQAISDQLSGVHVDWEHCAVGDLDGMVRYLIHFDDADKAQYRIEDIEALSGADVLEHFEQASDVDGCVGEMMDWLEEQGTSSFSKLARYARSERPDWFRVLTSKRTVYLSAYCKALGWEWQQLQFQNGPQTHGQTHENGPQTHGQTHENGPQTHGQTHENTCPECGSSDVKKNGKTASGLVRWRCKECGKSFV